MADVEMVTGLPRPGLRGLVRSYVGYRIWSAAGTHRGLPSRDLTFVITISDTVDVSLAGAPPQSLTALVSGLHAGPAMISHSGFQYGVQGQLTPLGARALFGSPAAELASVCLDLSTLVGPAAATLVERVRAAPDWPDRFTVLDDFIARTARAATIGAEIGHAWNRLAATDGRATVGDVAGEVGWSRQHLSERFRREFGLSPKVAARVMRFEAAGECLRSGQRPHSRRPALADIAARCGYADQAHLTREFRSLSGLTPTAWLAAELPALLPNVQDGTGEQG
jgi:AraC-like DNA-binding protein